jgi:vitamin B12/bleomycin/antimicrobial peptide transport system ATP-binding/permease protein
MKKSNQHFTFNRHFWRSFWRLLKPYWQSEEKKRAYTLLFLTGFFTMIAVEGNVWFSYCNKNFFNALQNFNKPLIWQNLLLMAIAITLIFLAFGFAFYVNGLLALRWRQWLTKNALHNWLAHKNYYRFPFLTEKVDNPDQRISEDMDQFTQLTLGITFQVLQSLFLFVSFGTILWRIGGHFSIPLGHFIIPIPGYLFWAACLFGGLGVWLTNRVGKKLVGFSYDQQRYNADFRFSLIKFRESREEVALQRGEQSENSQFNALFKKIYHNFIDIIQVKKRLTFVSMGFDLTSIPLAVLCGIPLFLSKKIQFGGLMQIANGFSSVVSSFTTLMRVYTSLADWNSVIIRLTELNKAIEQAHELLPTQLSIQKNNLSPHITLNNLSLFLPDGQRLLDPINLSLDLSENFLIKGSSGIGKSSLIRTLAGVWPFAKGTIYFPKNKKTFFLSQKTFFPLGTLKDSLIYPNSIQDSVTDEELKDLLRRFGLGKFQHELDEIKPWQQICSPGEQQLMALIRVVLNKPDILFLDEATSALDAASQTNAYQNLRLRLPNTSLISIGHRADLEQFHSKILLFTKNEPIRIVDTVVLEVVDDLVPC